MAVVLLGGHFVWLSHGVAWADIAVVTEAEHHPANGSEQGSVESVASALAHKTVESGVSQAVQAGQQQGQVVVVEYSWNTTTPERSQPQMFAF